MQAEMRKLGAKRGRLAMQLGVGDVKRMQAPIVIAPSQRLAPAAAVRIATCAEHFERRGDPHQFRPFRLAPAALHFDGEAACVHREGAKGHIGRPGIEWLAEARRRFAQRPKVRPISERVGGVVSYHRSSFAALRIDRRERGGVHDRNIAFEGREDRRDFEGVFTAGLIIVRPDKDAPASERRPIAFVGRLRAAARRSGDRLGKDASRRVRRFFALANDYRRFGLRSNPVETVNRAGVRPMSEAPSVARAPRQGPNVLFTVRFVPSADMKLGCPLLIAVGPSGVRWTAEQPRRRIRCRFGAGRR